MKTVIKILSLMLIVSLTLFAVSAGAEVNPDTSEPEVTLDDVINVTDPEAKEMDFSERFETDPEFRKSLCSSQLPPSAKIIEGEPAEKAIKLADFLQGATETTEGWRLSSGEIVIRAKLDSLGRIVPADESAYDIAWTEGCKWVLESTAGKSEYYPIYTVTYINTPKTDRGVKALVLVQDADLATRNAMDEYMDSAFPNAVRLLSATYRYNCHAYAWVKNTEYWVDDPSRFYSDGSYEEVSNPQVGDIVCYFDRFGSNIHSAVITDVSGNITVCSKWGAYGVYSHSLYDCPYEDDTVSVKYYRLHTNHVYTSYTNLGVSSGHSCTCDFCGDSTTEAHSWLAISNGYICGKCNAFTAYLPGIITSIPEDILEKMKEYEGLSEYAFAVDDNMIFCYVDGTCYFVEGNDEAAALEQVKKPAAELQGEEDLTS